MAAVRDPGLQAERTAIAWNRTALALLVNGSLVVRASWMDHRPLSLLLAALCLSSGGAAFVYGAWRRHHLLERASPIPSAAVGVAALTLLVLNLVAFLDIASHR